MPVFNYAMRRIFTSISTYIILAIFTILPIFVTAFIRPEPAGKIGIDLIVLVGVWYSLYSLILSFFVSFFIATILSKTISEEISDGSFLLIISKPLSRTRILTEKLVAVAIVMLISYLIVFFFPLLGYLTLGDMSDRFFKAIKNQMWNLFGIGLLLQFFILGVFSILAMYFNPRLITTAISLFVTFIIIVNILMNTLTDKSLFTWLSEVYIYVPIILITTILLPLNWFIFSRKSFG